MKENSLYPPFVLAVVAALFTNVFFPALHLATFAPFLAILYNRTSLIKALWIAFGCGLFLDLITCYAHLGIYGLNFVLVTALLYTQKKHFFEEKPIALSLFTFFIAATTTLLHLVLLHIFDKGVPFSWTMLTVDVFLYSLVDGVYAFLWFTSPLRLYNYIRKIGWKEFLKKVVKNAT